IIVVVEGQTESNFVTKVLQPHLEKSGLITRASIVGKAGAHQRQDKNRGGGYFKTWRGDICDLLSNKTWSELRVTTLFDLYGLPKDFPGLAPQGTDSDTTRRCDRLIEALGREFEDSRFIPYIQRHEFEALVLASLPHLYDWFDDSK